MKLFNVIQTSFENYDSSVRGYLSKILGTIGQSYTNTQIFGVIFEGIKGIMQNMMFYIEDAMNEQNIFTASRKKSILSLAKISGYEAYYGSAATGNVNISMVISNDNIDKQIIYIKNKSVLSNITTGMQYVIDLPVDSYAVDLSKNLVTQLFKILEGFYNTAQFSASGYALETFSVLSTYLIDMQYVNVYINGKKWTAVSNLYEMSEASQNYVLTTGYNGQFQVMFGNGTFGSLLPYNATVQIQYLCHNGSLGNIDQLGNTLFAFVSYGYDKSGNTIDLNKYFNILASNYITGGTDADSIQKIKSMIGYNSRSAVLANENNFELFLKRFSFVGNSNVWSEKNSMTITACIMQNLEDVDNYLSLSEDKLILTDDQKNMILQVLENSNRSFAGVSIKFIDPVIRRYAIICQLKVNGNSNNENIKTSIRQALSTYFSNIQHNTVFISKTDLIKTITDQISDVLYFDIQIISELAELTYATGYYYKNTLEFANGTYQYIQTKTFYEDENQPGLDMYGNIQLDSKLEIPVLSDNITYYPTKSSGKITDSVKLDAINFYFI